MKFSEDTDEHRKSNIDYVNQRWKQLHGLEVQFGSEGIRYLFLANAGATIAVLAFHGAFSTGGSVLWPKLMLAFFVTGMILTGVLYFARFLGADALFKHWQDLVIAYFNDANKWSDVVNEDIAKSRKISWVVYLAYASFACFVVGAVMGVLTFSRQPSTENQIEKVTVISPQAREITAPVVEQNTKTQVPEKIKEVTVPTPAAHPKEKKVEKVKKAAPAEQHNKSQGAEKISETKPETPAVPPPEKPKPEKKSFFNLFGDQ